MNRTYFIFQIIPNKDDKKCSVKEVYKYFDPYSFLHRMNLIHEKKFNDEGMYVPLDLESILSIYRNNNILCASDEELYFYRERISEYFVMVTIRDNSRPKRDLEGSVDNNMIKHARHNLSL